MLLAKQASVVIIRGKNLVPGLTLSLIWLDGVQRFDSTSASPPCIAESTSKSQARIEKNESEPEIGDLKYWEEEK